VNFADLVRNAGVEKDALGGRGFTCINVRTDADVAIPVDWGRSCHDVFVRRLFAFILSVA
jgi:hypothetical protein